MKHSIKDGLSVLLLMLILGAAFLLTRLTIPSLDASCDRMAPLAIVAVFFTITGFMGLGYLRLLNWLAPMKPGIYSTEHSQCLRWKHHTVIADVCERFLKPFFPLILRAFFFRILGMRMGRDATVALTAFIADPLLTRMGDHSIIGGGAFVAAHALVYDKFVLGPVTIGAGVTVGMNAVIMPGVEIGDFSIVMPGAVISRDTRIPSGEIWGGVPARKIKDVEGAVTVTTLDELDSDVPLPRTPQPLDTAMPVCAEAGTGRSH